MEKIQNTAPAGSIIIQNPPQNWYTAAANSNPGRDSKRIKGNRKLNSLLLGVIMWLLLW